MTTAKARSRWLDRKTAAAIVSAKLFPVSKRALEKWPIAGVLMNGCVHVREHDVLAHAKALLDRAPAVATPRLRKDR